MLEALGFEIGRLLEGIAPLLDDTVVIFLGDNGTPAKVPVAPFDPLKAKSTVYQGGIQVPMIISGWGVDAPGGECHALVNTTDVYATVAELVGVNLEALLPETVVTDSISFAPYLSEPLQPSLRKLAYAERFFPSGFGPFTVWNQAIRNTCDKFIRNQEGVREFFDLREDPFELNNLLLGKLTQAELRQYQGLEKAMDDLQGEKAVIGAKASLPVAGNG